MESTATTTNENVVPPIASVKSKVAMTTDTAKYDANGNLASLSATYPDDIGDTTDTAKYNADGSLASLSSTYPVDSERSGTAISEDPPTVSAIPASRKDVWDEMSALRTALKANSHGYLAKALVLTIGFCCFVSVLAGTVLAMPVIAVVAAYDRARKFFTDRKATKEAASKLSIVPGSERE